MSTTRTRWDRLQPLVLFLVVVFAFSVISIRSEIQQRSLERRVVQECEIRNEATRKINNLIDIIITSIKTNTTLTAAEKTSRLALYETAKGDLVNCSDEAKKSTTDSEGDPS